MMWYRTTPFELGGGGRARLKVSGLSAGYGAFLVLRDLKLEIQPGLTVVLGPNGAGKTTLLKALNGLIPRGGTVLLDGQEMPEKTHEIVQAGVALVPQLAHGSFRHLELIPAGPAQVVAVLISIFPILLGTMEGARSMPLRAVPARANEISKTGLVVFY